MVSNKNLNKAKNEKNNEWYTQRVDIENELRHYATQFEGKVVYCNCDDPETSEFWLFFKRNFRAWKLKGLIATHYEPNQKNYAYKIELKNDTNDDGIIDWNDEPTITQIPCNGDFRSQYCIDLLKEADIVVTNPPFSLFREYVAQLIEYNKKFLIIGNLLALKYKEIFPLLKNNEIWMGYAFNCTMIYKTPYKNELDSNRKYVLSHGYNPDDGYIKVPKICWYTNLEVAKRHSYIDLRGTYYDEKKYHKYDNFDAIEVKRLEDIPCDYEGLMGVPITIMGCLNHDQFELIGSSDIAETLDGISELGQAWIEKYKAQGGTGHYTARMKSLGYSAEGKHKIVPSRMIIKNKKPLRRNDNEN